jgi:hypothetical protein
MPPGEAIQAYKTQDEADGNAEGEPGKGVHLKIYAPRPYARQGDENSRGNPESRSRGSERRVVHQRGLFVLGLRSVGAASQDRCSDVPGTAGEGKAVDRVADRDAGKVDLRAEVRRLH